MAETRLVGVRTPWFTEDHYRSGGPFKREFLLWDLLALTNLSTWLPLVEDLSTRDDYQGARDFLWLHEQGFLVDVDVPTRAESEHVGLAPLYDVIDEVARRNLSASQVGEWNDALSRIGAVEFESREGFQSTPISATEAYQLSLPGSRSESVLELVLRELPVPEASVPYEQIVDFRSDEQSRRQHAALRRWTSRVARSELPLSEIRDEFEELRDSYRQHLRLHRMKYRLESTRILVSLVPEMLSHLLRLDLGKLADPLFRLGETRVDLLSAELRAPGREVAYVETAQSRFGEAGD